MDTMRILLSFLAVLTVWTPSVCSGAEQSDADALSIVLEILGSGDQEMQAAAIAMAKEMEGPEVTRALADELPKLSAAIQVQLLAVLGDRGEKIALPAVVAATKTPDAAVRVAALKALGQLGDESVVMLLAERAATTTGEEQKAARQSLYRLRGAGVDQAILAAVGKADAKAKAELVAALGRRNVRAAVETLFQTARDPDRKVRTESIKALASLAGPENLPALVDLLINAQSTSERTEAEKTIVAVAHKIEQTGRRASSVLARLPSVKDIKARCALLSTLGKIGDDSALPVLRTELGSKETDLQAAAIRALSIWPTPAPLPDLLKSAQQSKSPLHRILALRGLVRLLGLPSDRPAEQTIAMYRQAMSLAPNAMEKRRVLSGLSATKSIEALEMAADYLDDKDLVMEAEVAVVKIAGSIHKQAPKRSAELLRKVAATTKNQALRAQAQEIIKQIEHKPDTAE